MGPIFLLALRGDLQKFIVHFTETFNQTTLESYTVIEVTETPAYCSWKEANKWIPSQVVVVPIKFLARGSILSALHIQ